MLVQNQNHVSAYAFNETSSNYKSYLISLVSSVGNAVSYIFTPEEKPNWSDALMKTSAGFIGLFGIDKLTNEHNKIDQVAYFASTGLLMTGIRETCYLIYASVMYPNHTQKNNKIIKQKNIELAKIIKLSNLLLFSGLSIHCLYNYDTLGNISFFDNKLDFEKLNSISFLRKNDLSLTIFQMGMCIANLAINLSELKHFNQDRFLTYNPLFEIVNAFVFTSFISQMGRLSPETRAYDICINEQGAKLESWGTKNIDNVIDFCTNQLPKIDYIRRRILNEYKHAIFMNLKYTPTVFHYVKLCKKQTMLLDILSMLKKNMEEYWLTNPVLTKQVSQISIESETIKKIKRRYLQEYPKVAEDKSIIYDDFTNDSALKTIAEESCIIRQKKKTRGIADISKSTYKGLSPKSSSLQSQNHLDFKKEKREKALARIQKLREEYPIKVVIIESEIKKAVKFLNGFKVPVDGSEFRIEWTIGENRFALNYEIPHLKDATNYAGNKLKWVLNVLETCYLVGLSEESANRYIEQYNLYNLERIQKFVHYIFLNRTSNRDL